MGSCLALPPQPTRGQRGNVPEHLKALCFVMECLAEFCLLLIRTRCGEQVRRNSPATIKGRFFQGIRRHELVYWGSAGLPRRPEWVGTGSLVFPLHLSRFVPACLVIRPDTCSPNAPLMDQLFHGLRESLYDPFFRRRNQ